MFGRKTQTDKGVAPALALSSQLAAQSSGAPSSHPKPSSRGGRGKSPSSSAGKKTLPQVTMDDLFGTSKPNRIGAPIIDMGGAFEGDLPDAFTQAEDYKEFDFSSSALDVEAKPSGMASPGRGASKSTTTKPTVMRQHSDLGNKRVQGSRAGRKKEVSAPYDPSKSSFEAVFKGGAVSRNATHSVNDADFEMENPFRLETAGQVKEAAVKVLYSQNESLEDKARKLFFLDQLSKPAPPVVPPRLSMSNMKSMEINKKGRASTVRKKRGVRHYDPAETALGINAGVSGFVDFAEAMKVKTFDIGWRLRVEMIRDVASQIRNLHDLGKAHNNVSTSALIAVDTMRCVLSDEKNSVCSKKEDMEGLGRSKRDVLEVGVLALKACLRNDISSLDFLELFLQKERACTSASQFEAMDEDLYSVVDVVDRQVREALANAQTPGSLLELCAQCCSADRTLRPGAVDAWDWLDSIVDDMDKAAGGVGEPLEPSDVADQVSSNLKLVSSLKIIKTPKLVDVSQLASDADSDATSVSDTLSIASNDSFQPPSEDKRKSKLTDFISTATTSDDMSMGMSSISSGGGSARPQSLNLGTGNSAKLAMFLNNTASTAQSLDSTASAGLQAREHEKVRRRSLDRGYMWAKQKFAPDESDAAKNKRMTRRIVAQENVQLFEQQWKVAAATNKTRKAEEIAQLFSNQERLPQDEALGIIKKAEGVLKKEKNLLELKPPVIVVGDIHGQFFDLVNMIKLGGDPGNKKVKTQYLFLGDYVDRGDFSCEVLLYLLALKAEFPDNIFLLRGNHECRTVSSYFGFKEECEVKYGLTVFNRCVQAFQVMPIAAVVETPAGRFLCCHGGISPNITSLDQFAEYNRFVEPGMNGFLCDLLWSDPVKDAHEDGSDMSLGDFLSIDYLPNPARGCSYRYGFKALVSFLAVNKLVALIRAHEVQMAGYRYHFQELTGGKSKTAAQVMPPVVTVFSAPNYTNKYGNLGAFIRIHAAPPNLNKPAAKPAKGKEKRIKGTAPGTGFKPLDLLEPVQFKEVPHPAPMQFQNEQAEQVGQISSTCPYMPTTFHAFVKRSVEIAELDNDEGLLARERDRASRAIKPAEIPKKKIPLPASPPQFDFDDAALDRLVEDAKRESRRSLSAKLTNALGGEVKDTPEVTQIKADVASKKNWKALQQLGLDVKDDLPKGAKHVPVAERAATSRFEAAAENDGMNEMNPTLLAEKVEIAKKRIAEKGLEVFEDVTVFKNQDGASSMRKSLDSRKTLTSKRSSARLKVGDRDRPESVRGVHAATLEEGGPPIEEGAMQFNPKELLALQMLFLLIDRTDKGLIDADDLIAWSAEEGYAVQKTEADICLNAIDVDSDGKIGFEDYLAFAARCKDQWLVSQYSSVLSAVKTIQNKRMDDSDI